MATLPNRCAASLARRRGLRAAYANAALWAVGNGLVSSTLVVYLALDVFPENFAAEGIAISLIYSARRFVGVLRLAEPAIVTRWNSRKSVCIGAFVSSTIVLLMVPSAALPLFRRMPEWGIAALVSSWCVYHVLEYVGVVALWSWLGDLTPRRVRGRLLGRRQQWLVIGRIGGLATSFSLAVAWSWLLPESEGWIPLALSAAAGAGLMLLSVLPLVWMPSFSHCPSAIPTAPWRTLLVALRDSRYRRLIEFHCWFSFVNGITASAQLMYPRRVLGVSYEGTLGMLGMMRAGQSVLAPVAGRWTDRIGNRPVMIVAQLIVATGPLFFLFATRERWWILIGAFAVWIAYAALNVGLDNVQLKLADEANNAPYLAVLFTITDLFNGIAAVAGGLVYDVLAAGGREALAIYTGLFLVGWLGRTLAAALLVRLIEPGAVRLWR